MMTIDKQNHAGLMPMTVEAVIARRREKIAVIRGALALVLKLLVIALSGYIMLSFVYGVGVVNGEGMYPRLRDGDLVIYYRLEYNRNIGDIIVFTVNGQQQYGRIVAKGGDTVDMTEDGQLVVNGGIQQEEVFFPTQKDDGEVGFPITLQEGEVFVLGDNRTSALDSRVFGPIAVGDINGKVITLLRRRGL